MTGLVLLLLGVVPIEDGVSRHRVAVIERNHHHGFHGDLNFTQHIFWVDYADTLDMHVADWRILKTREAVTRTPDGMYRLTFAEKGRLVIVESPHFLETWTQFEDKEMADRSLLPMERREGINVR